MNASYWRAIWYRPMLESGGNRLSRCEVMTVSTGHVQADHFRKLVKLIVASEADAAIRMLDASPHLVGERSLHGAIRKAPTPDFFKRISRYMYEGDTALHMAAAAYQARLTEKLITMGANVSARNRRGAQPLHYAVDGGPGLAAWDPVAQAKIIALLIEAGADPNAVDKSGVAPLHRAVRNRCASAVRALIAGGADPKAPNKNGSTPRQLATQTTGRAGAGNVPIDVEIG